MLRKTSSSSYQKNNSVQDVLKLRYNGSSLLESNSGSRNERHAKIEVLRLLGNKRRSTIAEECIDPSSSLSTSKSERDSKTPIFMKTKGVLARGFMSPTISLKSDNHKNKLHLSSSKEKRKTLIGPISLSARKRNLTYTVNKNNTFQKSINSNNCYQQECKRSLVFKQPINEVQNEESFTQILPQVDLTSINIEGSMLTTSNSENICNKSQIKCKQISSPKNLKSKSFCIEKIYVDDKSNKENIKQKSAFQSRLPLLKRTSIASYPHSQILSECNSSKVLDKEALLTRRSMSAISVNLKKPYTSTMTAASNSVVISVTKPSLSPDDNSAYGSETRDNHVLNSKCDSSDQKNILKNQILLSQNESKSESSGSQCFSKNVDNNSETPIRSNLLEFGENRLNTILPPVLPLETSPLLPSLAIKVIVKNLHETIDQITQEQQQIAYEAEEFIEEIRTMVQARTKLIMDKYENSLLPLKNLEKLLIEKLRTNEIQEVREREIIVKEKADVRNEDNSPADFKAPLRKADYTFLGTPMPTRKKRLGRSFSHPQPFIKFNTESINHETAETNSSGEKNTSHSAEELSPFTNLVGDCERPSLAPMTPKTRHNLFNLKENLNQQLGLLFD